LLNKILRDYVENEIYFEILGKKFSVIVQAARVSYGAGTKHEIFKNY